MFFLLAFSLTFRFSLESKRSFDPVIATIYGSNSIIMKKLSILLLLVFLGFTGLSNAQQAKGKTEIASKETVQKERIKVDLDKLPNSILVSLRDSYAKYFVTQAYKSNKKGDVYFIELRRGRTLFTVAVDNKGRVLKEIRDGLITDKNAVANKN